MARFDRYILGQFLLLFGFFALVLVSVYWINHAIQLFDQLIADGHSALVFLEFTGLSLPKIIALVLPMAGFVAAVYVTNRLSNDSELIVVQATGFSSMRMARPALIFAVLITLMASILAHVLVPVSSETLKFRESEISGSVSARLLREGTFLHPVDGVTFYIREISDTGELQDVFLADLRDPEREVSYSSERAYLLREEEGPRLVMVDGVAQTFEREAKTLSKTNFDELVRDVSGLVVESALGRRKLSLVASHELLADTEFAAENANRTQAHVVQEIHWRIAQSLLCFVAVLIGHSAMLAGGFSRLGVTRQILIATMLLVLVKVAEGSVSYLNDQPGLWILNYWPLVLGCLFAALLYWRADHPHVKFVTLRARARGTEAA